VVVLAVAGRVALSGVGPFSGQVTAVEAAPPGLAVTLSVRNEGTKTGSTTCRITDATKHGVGPAAIIQSPRVRPGEAVTFQATISQFGALPRSLTVDCQSP
jgi:hypothetical protein